MDFGISYHVMEIDNDALDRFVAEGWQLHGQPFILNGAMHQLLCLDTRETQFAVVHEYHVADFERAVSRLLEAGWELHGPMVVYDGKLNQPLVRKAAVFANQLNSPDSSET